MGAAISFGFIEFLNHIDDIFEHFWFCSLDVIHKIPQLLFFRSVDDESIAILEKEVDIFGELGVWEEGVADLDVAIIFIIISFILS